MSAGFASRLQTGLHMAIVTTNQMRPLHSREIPVFQFHGCTALVTIKPLLDPFLRFF